jgi:hypothetical protein
MEVHIVSGIFLHRAVLVDLEVDKLVLKQAGVLRFSPKNIIPPSLHFHVHLCAINAI